MNDPIFNFSAKKYELKQEIERTCHECLTCPLIKANVGRIRNNILASLFKKPQNSVDPRKSHMPLSCSEILQNLHC